MRDGQILRNFVLLYVVSYFVIQTYFGTPVYSLMQVFTSLHVASFVNIP